MDITLDCVAAARRDLERTVRGEPVEEVPVVSTNLLSYPVSRRRYRQPNPILDGLKRLVRHLREGSYS